MKFTLPIRTKNPNNQRQGWRVVATRAKSQRQAAYLATKTAALKGIAVPAGGMLITLTRIAPRELDDDGSVASLKPTRDGVADGLSLPSDRDSRVTWAYAQRRGGVGEYAVEVEVSERTQCSACGAVRMVKP